MGTISLIFFNLSSFFSISSNVAPPTTREKKLLFSKKGIKSGYKDLKHSTLFSFSSSMRDLICSIFFSSLQITFLLLY